MVSLGKESKIIKFKNKILQINEAGLIIIMILLIAGFYIKNQDFLSGENIISILRSSVFYFIIGCGSTYVLVAGELDLSIGSLTAFCGIITTVALQLNIPVVLAIIIGILTGLLGGLINSIIVGTFKIPPLIGTLGTLYIFRGLINIITKGQTITISQDSFKIIAQGKLFGIPYLIFYAIIIGIIFHFILNYSKYGYNIRSTGGSKEAARVVGINIKLVQMSVYLISGFSCAIAGILMTSRLSVGSPSLATGLELYVVALVIIGGTSLFGGVGSIFGTVLGAIFMSIVQTGMLISHVDPFWQNVVIGLIMILAVGIDQFRRRRILIS
jgi:ribose/xylose/arabinose/galactoside ABC-type transport system permease subunit